MTKSAEDRALWTEGVCSDGAVILRDGKMVAIGEVLGHLNSHTIAIRAAETAARLNEREECAMVVERNGLISIWLAKSIAAAIRSRSETE